MFENDENVKNSHTGTFTYTRDEMRICLFLHKIIPDKYNPLQHMNTVAFMMGVPANNEIKGIITLKNPAKEPESFKTWTIFPLDENEARESFVKRFWTYWSEAKERILALHGENISIMYEGRMLDSNGKASNN